ncbi:protein Wiz isoform X1 [Oxyura jamaicensis]|uniref:protein Wiz isoform X1 n=1 Tax=Oxyura jamaicensis TaxID=8884 RepID=UPI0015A5F766|nr:protein Wiz isoform X1 [Oxyura jamaicensis]
MGPDVMPQCLAGLGEQQKRDEQRAPRRSGNSSAGKSGEAPCWEASGFLGATQPPPPGRNPGSSLIFPSLISVSRRFFRQSLAANPPESRCGVFLQVTQHNRQGMEKAVPTLSEQQRERQGDGGRALLMTLEPNKENFAALECPQGEERRAAFVKDAKAPLESPALSGTSVEAGTELKEAAFYTADNLVMMSRDGKGPSGTELCPLQEDPNFFSPLSRQEPDIALEAHDVADEPDPALSGAVPAPAHRTELGSTNEEHLEFQKALYRTDARSSLDLRNMTVSGSVAWDTSSLETRAGDGREESTLERLSGLKDSKDMRCGKESAFTVDPQLVNTVQVDPEELESDSEDLDASKVAAEMPSPCAGVPVGGGEEKYLKNEPKQLEGLSKEHLEKSKRGIQRVDWISRPNKSPSPHYKDISKPTDVATNMPIRGQAVREVPPPLTPTVFRKTLSPVLSKSKSLESTSSHRKGLVVDSDLGEISPLGAAEWTIQKPGLQLGTDLAVGKQSWTVNSEDSVERIPLMSLEPAPCSSYDIEMRPYVCSVLVEEQGKEELGPEEDPTVYTCIECSIYFKKKEHLMDHMLQHNRGPGRDQDRDALGGQCQFCCNECGWAFGDPTSLEQHKRLHQESREKIIEEIQKLNEFPDEGREARLQCPKCVFGTNSSKIFVQHAKMHVKERKDQGAKSLNLFGSTGSGEMRDSPVHSIYKHFKPNEHMPLQVQVPHGSGKGLSTCMLCSFPAPNENILKEHMKYTHSHLSWDMEPYEEDPNQPGTSRDAYSPARPGRFAETDYFGKADRLFPPPHQESASHYEAVHGFSLTHPRLDKSNGASKKDYQSSGFHARKAAPYAAPHNNLGLSGLSSAKVYSQFSLQQLKKKAAARHLEAEGDSLRSHSTGLEDIRHKWMLINDMGSVEEEISVTPDTDLTENRSIKPVTIPQAALDLKRTFRDTLKATDSSIASEEQQHQLRMMVPLVLLEEVNPHPKATKRPRGKPFKKKAALPSRDFMVEEPLPLDMLLLDSPLEGPLELDDLLDSDSPMLKNEERKCPYCPDRFHNGIGLANHVRGHLNRVGVSYNVRHFISAEEVKAIEQKFSFQKKKKKGIANFDPSTFSLMRCEFCGAGFDTRAGLSSHARAHLRDFGITNWELTISPINILKELLANSSEHPMLQAAVGAEPSSPSREAHGFVPRKSMTPMSECSVPRSPLSPFPPSWGDESLQSYRDVLAPEEEELVAMEVGSPPLPKKSAPAGQLDQPTSRIGTKLSPEPPGSKPEPQDSKSQNLTTCEVCGACFETRKGLSSHARSHLRQLGVAESESSGAPIDLLYELMKQKGKPDGSPMPPTLVKKSGSPKDGAAGSPRPALLALGKGGERPPDGPVNKAIKSPPGFSKSLSQPGSPILKKVPSALSGSPSPKNPEDKSSKLSLSPLQSSPKAQWPQVDEEGPLNLTSGSEPVRDIRCEFCGEYFENRKGLSSHARSHLRQMGVTEWYVNGSPIDTLREILKRRAQPRSSASNPAGPGQKAMAKTLLGSMGPLEPRGPGELHIPTLAKKVQQPGSPLGQSPTSSPPPTARKMFPGLSPPSLQKKLKQDQLRVEIKREMMSGGLHGDPHPSDRAWSPREEMSPLNLSSRADPVRDIRCEFCGEYFENRKGLSSHARSHLRQMGVTEWSVNGSPIDTLREILKKKSKPCVIKKEPHTSSIEPPKALGEEGMDPKSPSKMLQGMSLPPLGGRTGKPSSGGSSINRELSLSSLTSKPQGSFLTPLSAKRPLQDDRLGPHAEVKHKAYIQTELPFKTKSMHDKPAHTSSEACCELCGLYFENRKALASHARAHLRQFGVTEWCVNGSPIETLSEWIRHRPQKAGAYRSYIQGGRPFTKKFRNSSHARDHDGARRMPLSLQPSGVALLSKGLAADLAHGEPGKILDRGSGGERPMVTSPLSLVKMEEHQRPNIHKFERRQARPLDNPLHREEEGADFQQKMEETRQPPPRMRPVPSLVPRPPQTSLVKFVGNIYTLKCRFCEVEFQGPLSIQEEWVRHLQRHILEMNFSKADPLRGEAPAPEPPAVAEAQ